MLNYGIFLCKKFAIFSLCQTSDGLGRLAELWTRKNYEIYLSFQLSPKGGLVRVYKLPLYNFLSSIRTLGNDFMINRQMNQCYCKLYMQLNMCEMIKSIMKSTIQPYSIYLTKDEISLRNAGVRFSGDSKCCQCSTLLTWLFCWRKCIIFLLFLSVYTVTL